MREVISTPNAPAAIGTYSQAVRFGNTVYLSGQIGLIPDTMELAQGDIDVRIHQVFQNLRAVCEAAGGSLQDIAKLNIFLTDMCHFAKVNEIMAQYFQQPYPARAAVAVKQLPKDTDVEMDGVMVISSY
jgi:reactive intermediate/imine deaminase